MPTSPVIPETTLAPDPSPADPTVSQPFRQVGPLGGPAPPKGVEVILPDSF